VDRVYFFVDAIEGGLATLLPESSGEPITVRTSELPCGTREGDWLKAAFEPAPGKKRKVTSEIDELFGELGDNP
jgi:hypothetical protein